MLRRLLAARPILSQGPLHGTEELFFVNRLGKKINRPALHRSHRRRDVPSPGEKDHGNRSLLRNQFLHFQPAQSRHLEIENEAGARVSAATLEELPSTREEL